MPSAILRSMLAVSLLAGAAADVRAQGTTSSDLAKQLASLMSGKGLDAIAVRDPTASDRAIAALVFPASQLLVVSARYPEPATLDAALSSRQFREVYAALQQPTVNEGKVFVQDLGCDGLHRDAGSVDVMYENGTAQTVFDGDWRRQKISETAYENRLKHADARYTAMLSALLTAAQNVNR
jgi:hypothetical protein